MWLAEKRHAKLLRENGERGEGTVSVRDGLVIGLVQCFSLIPGVSRSGATISAGLLRGLDRVTATRLSFFLSIPALTAAGLYEGATNRPVEPRRGSDGVGIVVAFVVAYASIAWLLRFVATNTLMPFVWYRVALGRAHRDPRDGLITRPDPRRAHHQAVRRTESARRQSQPEPLERAEQSPTQTATITASTTK